MIREQINGIEGKLYDGRYKGPLDRLLAEILGKEGNDIASSSNARREAERNASTDGLY